MNKYILYSNCRTNVHTFVRTSPNGKESVVSSEEMKSYKKGHHFPDVMSLHHALVRMTIEQLDESGLTDDLGKCEAFEGILKVPFDKASEIVRDDK